MKNTVSTKVALGIVLFLAFLIQTPLYSFLLCRIGPATPIILLGLFTFYIALFICHIITFKKFFGVANFFKMLGILFVYTVIGFIVQVLSPSVSIAFIYQIISPLLLVGGIVLTFKAITKAKLYINPAVGILAIVFFGINVLCTCLVFFEPVFSPHNTFFSYLSTMSFSQYDNVLVSLCLYSLEFFTFWVCADSLPEPLQKEPEGIYVPPVAPENAWRCMGCGEFVSNEKNECDCGYKRP